MRTALKRYHVTMGAENTRFNAKLYVDFLYIEGASVLHMIDYATHFRAAKFVDSFTTESFRETVPTLSATFYTRLPNKMVLDYVSQFRDIFVEICNIRDVEGRGMERNTIKQ